MLKEFVKYLILSGLFTGLLLLVYFQIFLLSGKLQ